MAIGESNALDRIGTTKNTSACSIFDFDDLEELEVDLPPAQKVSPKAALLGEHPKTGPQEELIFGDQRCRPRGVCTNCDKCPYWVRGPARVSWDTERYRRCQRCNCLTADHEDLSNWLGYALKQSRYGPREAVEKGIPVEAFSMWDPIGVRLFIETGGVFHPGRHGRCDNPASDESANRHVLCSVICPTTSKRHGFHPLLYECYIQQVYQPRELVVIDTGDEPSAFLLDIATRDQSVSYRWLGPDKLSVGMKRNLACFLAKGDAIAHFDDDDLYAADYLEIMMKQLLHTAKLAPPAPTVCEPPLAPLAPTPSEFEGVAPQKKKSNSNRKGSSLISSRPLDRVIAITLSDWHVYDVDRGAFFFVSAMDASSIFGWGFSFVYTRIAWVRCPFPNVTYAEDYKFMQALRSKTEAYIASIPGDEVNPVCSHTYHPKVSTSGGERVNEGQLSSKHVRHPTPFSQLLPLLTKAEDDVSA